MENHYDGEITIDLIDMFFYFLKKWKSLLAVLLICTILGLFLWNSQTSEYVPSEAALAQMERAADARAHYEKELEAGDWDFTAIYYGKTLVETLEKSFSGDAQVYYQANFLGMGTPGKSASRTGFVEPVLICVLLGCIVWGGWYLLAYLLNSAIKTPEELSKSRDILLLGRVSGKKPSRGLTKLITAWEDKTKRPDVTPAYLAAVIDGAQEGTTVLCGDIRDEAVQSLMKELENTCHKITSTCFISESEAALKSAKEAEGSVLVIRTWHTRRDQIARELEMCRVQK